MKSLSPLTLTGLILFSLLSLLGTSATAATMLRMDLETLLERSDEVVIASVTAVTSKLEDDGRVYSTITLKVDEALKGQGRETLTFRQIGGRDLEADIATIAPGMPHFQEHERVLLFLHEIPDHKFAITGLNQGKFRIVQAPDSKTDFVIPQLRGLNFIDRPLPEDEEAPISEEIRYKWHLQTHPLESLRVYLLDLIELEQERTR